MSKNKDYHHGHTCPRCGGHRFKTIEKGKLYKCRSCGLVKEHGE